MTTTDSTDAVVVGAGLAGLTAARRLDEAGAGVTVLEARDRVGGRTLTREVDGHALDMGAQWIGPSQHRMHALVAFVLGDAAREWADRPEAERRRAVTDRLAAFFGPRAGEPNSYTDEVWNAGRWSHGCYAAMLPPGVLSRYADARADPVGRLHWAGTETATEGYGYMEGAVASGERAASEVRARLDGTRARAGDVGR